MGRYLYCMLYLVYLLLCPTCIKKVCYLVFRFLLFNTFIMIDLLVLDIILLCSCVIIGPFLGLYLLFAHSTVLTMTAAWDGVFRFCITSFVYYVCFPCQCLAYYGYFHVLWVFACVFAVYVVRIFFIVICFLYLYFTCI